MDSVNVIVFSQNLKLRCLTDVLSDVSIDNTVFVTTQYLFKNEKEFICAICKNAQFFTFADFLTDEEMAECDYQAYLNASHQLSEYYQEISLLKNELVIKKIEHKFSIARRIILCDDLGIEISVWIEAGYEHINGEYYYLASAGEEKKHSIIHILKNMLTKECSTGTWNGKKYVFLGKRSRIGYRICFDMKQSKFELLYFYMKKVEFKLFHESLRNNRIYLSTLHEFGAWRLKNDINMEVHIIQDGYLPPNYSSYYLCYVNDNVEYYTWDTLGKRIFDTFKLKNSIMPFGKTLCLPTPKFPKNVKKVLIVASGAGDWTAMKNRSDEDLMVDAFAHIASVFPNVEFVYRCHPAWIYPQHQGVNSIRRVIDYFNTLSLNNLTVSANIPHADTDKVELSFSRNSFEDDLLDADLVFGEHSVSMIDAGFKGIIFASVNLTKRRDFFCGLTEMGFPHCESIEEVISLIRHCTEDKFAESYGSAIDKYNSMTNEEH